MSLSSESFFTESSSNEYENSSEAEELCDYKINGYHPV
jgi:hypothetical protein